MRVAYLSTDFGVAIHGTSGSSVHVRHVVQALRDMGHATRLFSTSRYDHDKTFQDDDFQLVPLDGFAEVAMTSIEKQELGDLTHLRREFRRLMYSEYLQRALREPLVRFSPHIIYERYSLFSYAGIQLARSLGIPLILEVNAPLSIEASRHRGLVLTNAAQALEASIWREADRLFVVSAMLRDHALSLGVKTDRIEIARTGVDTAVFAPTVSGDGVRSKFGLSANKVVGFVGSLKPWHDLDTLLAAMHKLVESDPTYHLLVVGDGPRMEELSRTNATFVTYVGAVQHDAIPSHLAAMDVVAVPYDAADIHYFSPIKLFEAMAMAKPIVGASIGQVADVIKHGDTGLLYRPGDASELASSIERVIHLPDRGAGLGDRARQLAQERYSWRHVAQHIVASAESLLSRVPA